MRDQGVDVAGGVDDFAALVGGGDGLDVVSAGALGGGAFDLNAEQAAAVVEDEVVALGVAPGAGDTESEAGGLEQKSRLGEVAGAAGVRFHRRQSAVSVHHLAHSTWLGLSIAGNKKGAALGCAFAFPTYF